MSQCTVKSEGRRHYILGNTFAIKDQLRSAGCKWDPDRRAWWTGKRDVADRFSGREIKSEPRPQETGLDLEVIGKASYKGKTYYVVWEGQTRLGHGWKLAFTDGSSVFWAKTENGEPTWVKRYQTSRTIREIKQYAQQVKSGQIETCAECGYTGSGMQHLADSSGIVAPVCRRCAAQTTQFERSYA
jgi:hypothetical protein